MFAVVKIAGQQFKVQEGDTIYVPHLTANNGDKVEFNEVLLLDNEGKITLGAEISNPIKAEVVKALVQDDKVIAYKQKRRKGFRKKIGHRTQFTQVKIASIA